MKSWWVGPLLAWWLAATALAQSRPFAIGGDTLELDDLTADTAVYFRSMRPLAGRTGWIVDLVVSNRTAATFTGPFVVRFATAQHVGTGIVGTVPDRDGAPYLDFTAQIANGVFTAGGVSKSLSIRMGSDAGTPSLKAEFYGRRAPEVVPLLVTQTLGSDGLPLAGVDVEEVGPASARHLVSGRGGWLTLDARPDTKGWRFSAAGRDPSFRAVPAGLGPGVVAFPSVRLARSGEVPDAQSLPGPLPRGWSPLAQAVLPAGTASLVPSGPVPSTEQAVLARWDDAVFSWRVESNAVI